MPERDDWAWDGWETNGWVWYWAAQILGFMNLCSIVCICIAKICYMGWGSTGPAVSRVLVGGFDLVLVALVANIRIYGYVMLVVPFIFCYVVECTALDPPGP
jgi:hypothetical protein